MLSGWIIINLPGSPYPAAALTGPPFLFTIYIFAARTLRMHLLMRSADEIAHLTRHLSLLRPNEQLFIIFYSRVSKQWRQETKPNDSVR